MIPEYINSDKIHHFIKEALQEDIGSGDHTTLGSINPEIKGTSVLKIKDHGIIAGVKMAQWICEYIDSTLIFNPFVTDGSPVKNGEIAFELHGSVQKILMAERLILNTMQRMSGIATKTQAMLQLLDGLPTKLLDTRKTTPNFRMAEKWAVYIGGGTNHRFGLYDMILLKDNHIDFCGGIGQAVQSVRKYLENSKLDLKIEVETRTLDEVKQALSENVDVILLDNMSIAMLSESVQHIAGSCKSEASGGVTAQTIREIALTGVDYISVGALTHSYNSLDLSLKAIK